MIHQITDITKGDARTKCGLTVKKREATAWWTDVTCEQCLPNNLKEAWLEARNSARVTPLREQSHIRHTDTEKESEMARTGTLTIDEDLAAQVVTLRDAEEKKWDEIGEITGVAVGKCMLVYSAAKVPKKEIIKNPTVEDIVRLRNERALSWGDIMVRTGLNEGQVRAMYTEGTGASTKGNRIGKGGRHPGESNGTAAPKAAAKVRTVKAAAPEHDLFADADEETIKAMLTGYAIKVDNGDGTTEPIKVKAVKRAVKGKVILTDGTTGESRTIKMSAISAISKKKVS